MTVYLTVDATETITPEGLGLRFGDPPATVIVGDEIVIVGAAVSTESLIWAEAASARFVPLLAVPALRVKSKVPLPENPETVIVRLAVPLPEIIILLAAGPPLARRALGVKTTSLAFRVTPVAPLKFTKKVAESRELTTDGCGDPIEIRGAV